MLLSNVELGMDRIPPEKRSEVMARVRSNNTAPELAVRRIAHRMGLRFRLHRRDLPGTPDIVFPRWHLVIFVHGCFWHRHLNCPLASIPKTRREFWTAKLQRNVERDQAAIQKLTELGWRTIVIWGCEAKLPSVVRLRISRALRQRNFLNDSAAGEPTAT